MAKQVMPQAQLEARATDIKVPDEALFKVSLFSQLKRKPSLDKFPGTLVLRHYRKGDVVCRQGEAGWTAFYILTTEDVCELAQAQAELATPEQKPVWQQLLRPQAWNLAQLKAGGNETEFRRAATAHLMMAGSSAPTEPPGLLQRLTQPWRGHGARAGHVQPVSIPIDGPTDIDYETMQAHMSEGELFGEKSCRYGTPRSATIIAARDCFMLEMLRNILEQVHKDTAYKARTDEAYRKQVLQFQMRKLSIFADLTQEQFQGLRDHLELVTCEPGQVIYDEYEKSDSVYVISSGMVKVLKKASALLSPEHIRNWQTLAAALVAGEREPTSARDRIWRLLPENIRAACTAAAAGQVPESQYRLILQGLNEVLKNRKVSQMVEFQKVAATEAFQQRGPDFPVSQKDWSDQDYRHFNRLLVEVLYPDMIRGYRRRVGPDCVLYYCSGGEFIGEMSVMGQLLRAETCVAQGQPKDVGTAKDAGPVELVRIPAAALGQLLDSAPALLDKLRSKISERKKRTQERVRVPIWDESREVLLSERFQRLGLIEGQQLMLIDMDRCTRCDECVRACVATHDDGRSRLFLDGPRFGKYLVPTSCRSCLDPVCMIGCPVGSIHRGDNGQMVIEDWCIGCGLCAQQCPYGSIQMHDIGVIAEDARGWRYLPVSAVKGDQWLQTRFRDRRWLVGSGPFRNDRVFRETLAAYLPKQAPAPRPMASMASLGDFTLSAWARQSEPEQSARVGQELCFRHAFALSAEQVRSDRQFKLTLITGDPSVRVWVNGQELADPEQSSGGKREYWMPPKPATGGNKATYKATHEIANRIQEEGSPLPPPPRPLPLVLRAGRNVLAVRVAPDHNTGDVFLRVRLDEIRKPTVAPSVAEEVSQKLVTERAVVCDLCSSQLGQRPACVNACPHDAAMRIDARSEFPVS